LWKAGRIRPPFQGATARGKVKKKYLGDSYDLVKRVFGEVLCDVAPLYADPMFIPKEIHEEFTKVTGIPILPKSKERNVGILLDPTTGISLKPKMSATKKHASNRLYCSRS